MCDRQTDILSTGGSVLLISFEPPEHARRFAEAEPFPFPLLLDPDHEAYRAYGLERATGTRLWNWSSLRAYLDGLRKGRMLRLPRGDIAQLGGDFVIDERDRIVFAHRSAEPADRPRIEAIIAAMRSAGRR